jgi:hypothetical protein
MFVDVGSRIGCRAGSNDAIVVTENIYQKVESGMDPEEASIWDPKRYSLP